MNTKQKFNIKKSSKRASLIFPPLLVIIALIVLVFALIALKDKTEKIKSVAIGERQIEIFTAYQEGENILFYLDNAGKYAAENALENLAESGGYLNPKCGTDSSVVLWEKNGKGCSPNKEDLTRAYESYFNSEISKYETGYKSNYESEQSISMPFSYSYSYGENNEIIMKSNDFLVIGKYSEYSKSGSIPEPFSGSKFNKIPVDGPITVNSCFGYRGSDWHDGIDLPVPEGTPIKSVGSGTVNELCPAPCGGYGNAIVIKHNDKLFTAYKHLSSFKVKKGQQVAEGDVIALSGNTGHSQGPHLHFTVYEKESDTLTSDTGVNPFCYVPLDENHGITGFTGSGCNSKQMDCSCKKLGEC